MHGRVCARALGRVKRDECRVQRRVRRGVCVRRGKRVTDRRTLWVRELLHRWFQCRPALPTWFLRCGDEPDGACVLRVLRTGAVGWQRCGERELQWTVFPWVRLRQRQPEHVRHGPLLPAWDHLPDAVLLRHGRVLVPPLLA